MDCRTGYMGSSTHPLCMAITPRKKIHENPLRNTSVFGSSIHGSNVVQTVSDWNFENSEIVDRRNPTPEAVRLRGRPAIRGIGSATLTVSFSDYPSPPSDIALNADVEMMHQRYLGYAKVASHLPAWPISVLLFSNPRRANRSASEQ